MSRRVVFIKKRRATPYIKKRTCTAAKYEKTSKILCQNCVASLFLLRFLTFCVVRDHEAMGSNPVTPTRKKTNSHGLVFFQRCVPLHGTWCALRARCPLRYDVPCGRENTERITSLRQSSQHRYETSLHRFRKFFIVSLQTIFLIL